VEKSQSERTIDGCCVTAKVVSSVHDSRRRGRQVRRRLSVCPTGFYTKPLKSVGRGGKRARAPEWRARIGNLKPCVRERRGFACVLVYSCSFLPMSNRTRGCVQSRASGVPHAPRKGGKIPQRTRAHRAAKIVNECGARVLASEAKQSLLLFFMVGARWIAVAEPVICRAFWRSSSGSSHDDLITAFPLLLSGMRV